MDYQIGQPVHVSRLVTPDYERESLDGQIGSHHIERLRCRQSSFRQRKRDQRKGNNSVPSIECMARFLSGRFFTIEADARRTSALVTEWSPELAGGPLKCGFDNRLGAARLDVAREPHTDTRGVFERSGAEPFYARMSCRTSVNVSSKLRRLSKSLTMNAAAWPLGRHALSRRASDKKKALRK
jgi:hypothetical protein